ncbi:MAG: hypothetical protein LBO66_12920, partial [Deltaproteobacteria bacterium]|nr:hypothetical protein [Deltaproteobacteria bacterium]
SLSLSLSLSLVFYSLATFITLFLFETLPAGFCAQSGIFYFDSGDLIGRKTRHLTNWAVERESLSYVKFEVFKSVEARQRFENDRSLNYAAPDGVGPGQFISGRGRYPRDGWFRPRI